MEPAEWFAQYRTLHNKAKTATLTEVEAESHRRMSEELIRSVVSAQGVKVTTVEEARKHFKVAQMFAIEINNLYKTLTKEISLSGFVVTVPIHVKDGDLVAYSLTLARNQDAISGNARVVSSQRQPGNSRLVCSFDGMPEPAAKRLELMVIEAVLDRVK